MRWRPAKKASDATPFDTEKDARAFVLREGIPRHWPDWALLHHDGGLVYVGLRKGGPFLALMPTGARQQ